MESESKKSYQNNSPKRIKLPRHHRLIYFLLWLV